MMIDWHCDVCLILWCLQWYFDVCSDILMFAGVRQRPHFCVCPSCWGVLRRSVCGRQLVPLSSGCLWPWPECDRDLHRLWQQGGGALQQAEEAETRVVLSTWTGGWVGGLPYIWNLLLYIYIYTVQGHWQKRKLFLLQSMYFKWGNIKRSYYTKVGFWIIVLDMVGPYVFILCIICNTCIVLNAFIWLSYDCWYGS